MQKNRQDRRTPLLLQLVVLANDSNGTNISPLQIQRALDAAGIDAVVLECLDAADTAEERLSDAHMAASKTTGLSVRFSIVIPVYNEEENLLKLYSRLTQTMTSLQESYELIFVDDGSRDDSAAILEDMYTKDREHVRIVCLSRNFGHQQAISAGLDCARGRAVVVMDADLQDAPETIPTFIERWEEGYQVVYAVRGKRKEHIVRRALYRLFYLALRGLSGVDVPLDAGDFGLMDRCVVDVIRCLPERNRFVRGLRSWAGFRRIGVPCDRDARSAGKTKYTFRKLAGLALDGLISFSYFPLRLGTVLGFGVSALSIVLGAYYLVRALTTGIGLPGFTTIVILMSFLGGVQLLTIGVIGEYIGHILDEVKHRPAYIVGRAIGFVPSELPTKEGSGWICES